MLFGLICKNYLKFCNIKRLDFIPPINGVEFPAHCVKIMEPVGWFYDRKIKKFLLAHQFITSIL